VEVGAVPESVVHSAETNGRGLHALIIGVGDYPHLVGGRGTRFEGHEGMGQLTSAPASARAFAEWLLSAEGYHHPELPLSSARLLLSEAGFFGAKKSTFKHPATGAKAKVPGATLAEVKTAIGEWAQALNSSEDNRGLFFFSGHGVMAGIEQWLLLSDYGADALNPSEPAIRFNAFHAGMGSIAAREQLYFLDACRSLSEEAAATFASGGTTFVTPNPRARFTRPRQPPVFNATLQGEEAFGRKGEPSFFTQALLDAMRGGGSDDSDADGRWKVETNNLNRVVQWLVGRTARREGLRLAPINSGLEMSSLYFSYLRSPPLTPVGLACDPEEASAKAVYAAGEEIKWSAKDRDPLLPLGPHRFVAEFEDGSFQRSEGERDIRPPYRELRLPVKQ
jgi:Caspase domain